MTCSVFILFLSRPTTPSSTLFPYTTLFRSRRASAGDGGRTRARTWDPLIKSQLLYQLSYAPEYGPPPEKGAAIASRVSLDRKSTRLNSSHLGISYAVFCLKKKRRYKNKRTA